MFADQPVHGAARSSTEQEFEALWGYHKIEYSTDHLPASSEKTFLSSNISDKKKG